MKNTDIDYKKIFIDILDKKYPEKKQLYNRIVKKDQFSVLEVIKFNNLIFNTDNDSRKLSQCHRSYRESDILKILEYQKKNALNNSQLANHFKLSRNTVSKWKKIFTMK